MQTVTLPPVGTRGIIAYTILAVICISFAFLVWWVIRHDGGADR